MKLLQNKVAIITGASRGIGKGIAEKFAEQGCNIAFTFLSSVEKAKAFETELASKYGVKVKGYQSDAADFKAADQLVTDVVAEFGTVDVLVNNAGITRDTLLMRMSDDEWFDVINTNLSAVFRLSKGVLRGMMKARWGRIINISSVVGAMGNPGQSNYAATKAGVAGFAHSLAAEVGSRGITVNTVAPGFIDTDMTKVLPEEQKQILLSRIPLGRLGAPEEIAAVVAFLASDAGGYITGETIHVNGGMYMA